MSPALRQVCIIHTMRIPAPGRMRLYLHTAWRKLLKPAKAHAPDISVFGRQGPPIGQLPHTRPWKRDLGEPPLVHDGPIVDLTIHLDGGAHAWEVPVQERPAAPAWMRPAPEGSTGAVVVSAKGQRIHQVKLGHVEPPAPLVGVLPD